MLDLDVAFAVVFRLNGDYSGQSFLSFKGIRHDVVEINYPPNCEHMT